MPFICLVNYFIFKWYELFDEDKGEEKTEALESKASSFEFPLRHLFFMQPWASSFSLGLSLFILELSPLKDCYGDGARQHGKVASALSIFCSFFSKFLPNSEVRDSNTHRIQKCLKHNQLIIMEFPVLKGSTFLSNQTCHQKAFQGLGKSFQINNNIWDLRKKKCSFHIHSMRRREWTEKYNSSFINVSVLFPWTKTMESVAKIFVFTVLQAISVCIKYQSCCPIFKDRNNSQHHSDCRNYRLAFSQGPPAMDFQGIYIVLCFLCVLFLLKQSLKLAGRSSREVPSF